MKLMLSLCKDKWKAGVRANLDFNVQLAQTTWSRSSKPRSSISRRGDRRDLDVADERKQAERDGDPRRRGALESVPQMSWQAKVCSSWDVLVFVFSDCAIKTGWGKKRVHAVAHFSSVRVEICIFFIHSFSDGINSPFK